jgi:hypothetical protein
MCLGSPDVSVDRRARDFELMETGRRRAGPPPGSDGSDAGMALTRGRSPPFRARIYLVRRVYSPRCNTHHSDVQALMWTNIDVISYDRSLRCGSDLEPIECRGQMRSECGITGG